jgi:hypothetical protein
MQGTAPFPFRPRQRYLSGRLLRNTARVDSGRSYGKVFSEEGQLIRLRLAILPERSEREGEWEKEHTDAQAPIENEGTLAESRCVCRWGEVMRTARGSLASSPICPLTRAFRTAVPIGGRRAAIPRQEMFNSRSPSDHSRSSEPSSGRNFIKGLRTRRLVVPRHGFDPSNAPHPTQTSFCRLRRRSILRPFATTSASYRRKQRGRS